jgi:hypothetical protein
MEMKERLPARVEDTGLLLDHTGPTAHVVQYVDDIGKERGWTVRHRSAQGARHF